MKFILLRKWLGGLIDIIRAYFPVVKETIFDGLGENNKIQESSPGEKNGDRNPRWDWGHLKTEWTDTSPAREQLRTEICTPVWYVRMDNPG